MPGEKRKKAGSVLITVPVVDNGREDPQTAIGVSPDGSPNGMTGTEVVLTEVQTA